MVTHRFYRENGGWYIDLPEYLAGGGSKGDLAMVSGADTMLDTIAGEGKEVFLDIDLVPFEGSDEVLLTEICQPSIGGGMYLIKRFERKEVNQKMWLCGVTEFVFGHLPEKIYLKRRT